MNGKIIDENRSCESCSFSHGIQTLDPQGKPIVGQIQLVCMRRPPCCFIRTLQTPLGETSGIVTQFPPVNKDMFCYDYWPEDGPLPGEDLTDIVTGMDIVRD